MTVDNNKNFPKKCITRNVGFQSLVGLLHSKNSFFGFVGFALPRLSQINSSAQITGIRINLVHLNIVLSPEQLTIV